MVRRCVATWMVVSAVGALSACGRFGFSNDPQAADDGDVDANGATSDTIASTSAGKVLLSDDFSTGLMSASWAAWRTSWQVANGHLESLPQARPGFNYGHTANGRGAEVIAGFVPTADPLYVGDPQWTNYRVSLDVNSIGMDPGFNPYALAADCRGFGVNFRMLDGTESWNDPYSTFYTAFIYTGATSSCGAFGGWSLARTENNWISNGAGQPGLGYCNFGTNTCVGNGYTLATGTTTAVIDGTNHVDIEINGDEIKLWFNGTQVADYVDDTVGYMGSDAPITYGGISVSGVWDSMLWIDNVVVTTL